LEILGFNDENVGFPKQRGLKAKGDNQDNGVRLETEI